MCKKITLCYNVFTFLYMLFPTPSFECYVLALSLEILLKLMQNNLSKLDMQIQKICFGCWIFISIGLYFLNHGLIFVLKI